MIYNQLMELINYLLHSLEILWIQQPQKKKKKHKSYLLLNAQNVENVFLPSYKQSVNLG